MYVFVVAAWVDSYIQVEREDRWSIKINDNRHFKEWQEADTISYSFKVLRENYLLTQNVTFKYKKNTDIFKQTNTVKFAINGEPQGR